MAQLVMTLLCKHDDPNLVPRTHIELLSTGVESFNPSTGKVKTGSLGSLAAQCTVHPTVSSRLVKCLVREGVGSISENGA